MLLQMAKFNSVDGHLGCFHVLAIANNTAMDIGVHVSFWISVFAFFRHIPRSGISRSYGSLLSVFWETSILFNSGCTNLHFYQQCIRVPFFSTPSPTFVIVDFLIIVILTGVRWYLIVVLICISLMISDVEHLFMCLLSICISSLEKYLFSSSAHFLIGLFVFLMLSCTFASSWWPALTCLFNNSGELFCCCCLFLIVNSFTVVLVFYRLQYHKLTNIKQ